MTTPQPESLVLHQRSRELEIVFQSGERFRLPCEYLRVMSPSAEVRGHGPGQKVLQTGKRSVGITEVKPVGNYAVALHFDDGHDTGIYSWQTLYDLGVQQERYWNEYLDALEEAGESRDP